MRETEVLGHLTEQHRVGAEPDADGRCESSVSHSLGNESAGLTGRQKPRHCTTGLPGLIREVSERIPNRPAARFGSDTLSYRQLEVWSDAVARTLRDCAPKGLPVVVAVPRSTALLAALLGVLKAGLPYLPVDPDDPPARLAGVLETARSHVALVDARTLPVLAGQGLRPVEVEALRGAPDAPDVVLDPLPEAPAEQPAYVLFTSGSTGRPKGVVLPSLALCNRLLWMRDAYDVGPEDRVLQKTPVTFDVSGWELWLPLITGATCVFLPPEEHRDPALVACAIQEHGITVCHFVPSMLREFLRRPDAGRCSSLRHVFCSGEALPLSVARGFAALLPARLHNLYGPTEAAIDVTHWTCPERAEDIDRILIGRPVDNCVLGVFDPDGRPVPDGDEGELYIGGMPLALGYLNRQDLTDRAFVPADADASVRTWYRTGDRVRLLDAGLEYLGRVDDQVKIRGQRIEPQEVEHHLAGHAEVAAGVVVAARVGEDMELVAWIQPADGSAQALTDGGSARRLREHLADLVPPGYVPTHFLAATELPLTSSGKRDRKLLRQRAEQRLNAHRPAPRAGEAGEAQDVLGEIWCEALPQQTEAATDERSFLALGGHSLLGARLATEIHYRLGVSLPAGYFVRDDPTLAELREAVAKAEGPQALPETPTGPTPAAPGQHRIWLLSRMFPQCPAYNVVGALRVDRELEAEPLAAAVTAVVARHPMLRGALHDDGSDLLLAVHRPAAPEVLVEHGEPGDEDAFLRRCRDTVLDPERAPLYRVAVLNTGDGSSLLVITLHHAVADQRTLDIVLEELAMEYGRATGSADPGMPEPPPAADYRQYAVLQTQRRAGADKSLEYWRTALADAPAMTDLPFRLPPSAVPSFAGGATAVTLDEDADRAVRDLAVRAGTTPAVLFLTAAALVLARWARSDELVVGVAASARDRAEFQRTVGFFVDTVPVRLDIRDRPTMATALERVREALARGLEHSAVPFDEIVSALRPHRSPLDNPLFQTWFNDLSEASPPARFADAAAEPVEVPVGWALFDLGFYLHRDQGRYRLQVVHAVDRYDRAVAQAALEQWRTAVLAMTEDLGQAVTAFGDDRPATPPASPTTECATVSSLVDDVLTLAARTPEATALVGQDGSSHSYGWLRDAVLSCSAALSEQVAPGGVVAVVARRDPLLPVALLGVWHSGRPALLLDAEPPVQWRQDAMRQTGAAALLRVGDVGAASEEASGLPVLHVADLLDGPLAAAVPAVLPPDFGHALLTSGTTGRPSVVLAPADALPIAFAWYAQELGLGPHDVFCALAGAGHDPILREMVLPLTVGARVVVPAAAERFDPVRLLRTLRQRRCTVLDLTPGHAQLLAAAGGSLPDVRRISCYGAPLTDTVARALQRLAPKARLYNVYGTTETPQASSLHLWSEPTGRAASRPTVPVGRGTGYRTLEVVTSSGSPAAVGQLGEVVVSGSGLALGTEHRTGDLGRRTPDGDVEICGRIDRQLSVRGYRVEPAAVEAVLTGLASVADAAVGMHPDRPDVLLALIVPAARRSPLDQVERQVRGLLPAWSVPELLEVTAIPLDRNGKPDLSRVPDRSAPGTNPPRPGARHPRGSAHDPVTTLQEAITTAVHATSGHAPGPEQHFFDAGLTSLDMLRLHRRLADLTGADLAVTTLFRFPTVRSLALHLADRNDPTDAAPLPGSGQPQSELQARRVARNLFSSR
ncbi:amino acid adenylation domain-containing protein [Streptomyces sp. NPDC049687]|uniref:amino acid adenylation domain-containing protein n=1 Tax=Streptomyces sp. NPDC049687 TaxID=3365596 RepID=UPI0037B846C1